MFFMTTSSKKRFDMERDIIEKQKELLFNSVNELCKEILSEKTDIKRKKRQMEKLCFLSNATGAEVIDGLTPSAERVRKWLDRIKPFAKFRYGKPVYDSYCGCYSIKVRKGKKEVEIDIYTNLIIFSYDGCEEYIFGSYQFVLSLQDIFEGDFPDTLINSLDT